MRKRECPNLMNSKGASAIEFALAFPVLFILFYGILTYSFVFAVNHSLSAAASEAARVSMRFQSASDDQAVRVLAACKVAKSVVRWMERFSKAVACGSEQSGDFYISINAKDCNYSLPENFYSNNNKCLHVRALYEYKKYPIIPAFFPLIVPPLLTGEANAQIRLSL